MTTASSTTVVTVVAETVTTPWSLAVEVDGRFSVSLRVENPDDTGTVRCAIDYDGPASPIATGEIAADCDLDGNVDGNSLTTSSSALGEEREGPEVLDEESGLTFELVTLDADDAPVSEPQLYERLVYRVVLGPITEPGRLRVGPRRSRPVRPPRRARPHHRAPHRRTARARTRRGDRR